MPTLVIILLVLSWLSPILGDEIVMTILTLAYFWYNFNPKDLEPTFPQGPPGVVPPPPPPPSSTTAEPTIIDVEPEDP